jgi:hypothetical protein
MTEVWRNCHGYNSQDETVRFAYVTNLRIEGKQTHILCNPNTLPIQEPRQRATKYCSWEIMFIVWAIYASLPATPSAPLITVPFYFQRTWNTEFRPDYCNRSRRCIHSMWCEQNVTNRKLDFAGFNFSFYAFVHKMCKRTHNGEVVSISHHVSPKKKTPNFHKISYWVV